MGLGWICSKTGCESNLTPSNLFDHAADFDNIPANRNRFTKTVQIEASVSWHSLSKKVPAVTREFFDPSPEHQNVVLIDTAILHEAERLIESCEGCNPEGAEIPFDNILDRVTGSDPS